MRRVTKKKPFMGMERVADYLSSEEWRASLFTTTLGLHGFCPPSSLPLHTHTQTNTNRHGNILKSVGNNYSKFGHF